MEEIEITIYLENRCISADLLKGGTLIDLMREFDEICKLDEALTMRRLHFSPTFSLIQGEDKKEIKRKYKFNGGEKVHVGWSPLQTKDTPGNAIEPLLQTGKVSSGSLQVHETHHSPADPSNGLEEEDDSAETLSEDERDHIRNFEEGDLSQFGSNATESQDMFESPLFSPSNVSTNVDRALPSSSSSIFSKKVDHSLPSMSSSGIFTRDVDHDSSSSSISFLENIEQDEEKDEAEQDEEKDGAELSE